MKKLFAEVAEVRREKKSKYTPINNLRQNVSGETAAMGTKFKSLACHLETLPDTRKVKGRRHVLLDILIIALLALPNRTATGTAWATWPSAGPSCATSS
jgi:hypothetical protein